MQIPTTHRLKNSKIHGKTKRKENEQLNFLPTIFTWFQWLMLRKCMTCHVSELEIVQSLLFLFACHWIFKILHLLAGNRITCFAYRPTNKQWILLTIEYQLIEKLKKVGKPTSFSKDLLFLYVNCTYGLSNLASASLNHSTIKIAECILYWRHSITLDVTGKKKNKQTIKQPKSNKEVIFSISGDKILEIFSVYGICFNFLKSFLNDKIFDFPLRFFMYSFCFVFNNPTWHVRWNLWILWRFSRGFIFLGCIYMSIYVP